MKIFKIKALSALLFLVFASTIIFVSNNVTVKAATVLQVPSTTYPTIQSALNAANGSDTINVASGTYNEKINYNGYSNNILSGRYQVKTGITLQGAKGTIINGDVTILYLTELKIDSLIITGSLTLGDSSVYGFISHSSISNLQVSSTTTIGGSFNILTNNVLHGLILKGGNGKMEDPAWNTLIENNQILNGITIKSGSYANTIKGNIISNAEVGILEEPSKTYYPTGQNQIYNNTITNNNVGISLYCSTGDTGAPSHTADQIIQNIIKNNTLGIEFLASNHYVYGNIIYHNDFIDNKAQAFAHNPVTNIWDNGPSTPQTGNYWSDYKGKDANNDGVGDTPYIINTENQDNYPLMHPWSTPNPTPTTSPTPVPPTPTPSPFTSTPAPSNPAASSPTASPADPSNSQASIVPELTPLAIILGLVAVSAATILLKRKQSIPA